METSQGPQEVAAGSAKEEVYWLYRAEDALGAPYNLPETYLRGIRPDATKGSEFPIIAFINAKSGGRAGPSLARALKRAIGRNQVFDLSEHRPDKVLTKLWDNFKAAQAEGDAGGRRFQETLRILVAGGDGTIAWVLAIIKELGLKPAPAVAIMPLGTGNDLSRSFGWGPAFQRSWINSYDAVYCTLMRIASAKVDNLDCWRVRLELPREDLLGKLPHSLRVSSKKSRHEGPPASAATTASAAAASTSSAVPAAAEGSASGPAPGPAATARTSTAGAGASAAESSVVAQGLFWNYLSVGLDAKAAHGFHSLREERPGCASGRLMNQFWYSFFSCTSGWFCCTKPLSSKVSLAVCAPGSDTWTNVPLDSDIRALVVLNLQSYAGGRNLWGSRGLSEREKERGLKEPSLNDGLLEVVGLTSGYHTAGVMATKGSLMHARRICQASALRLSLRAGYERPDGDPSHVYLQVDGEPWLQDVPSDKGGTAPVVVEVGHCGVSKLLHNYTGLGTLKLPVTPSKVKPLVPTQGGKERAAGPKPASPTSPTAALPAHMVSAAYNSSVSGLTAPDSEAVQVGSERLSSPSMRSMNLSMASRSTTQPERG